MTIDDAKRRWCPFAKIPVSTPKGAIAGNRTSDGVASAKAYCLATECMAWRTLNTEEGQRGGYCGLAGRPE